MTKADFITLLRDTHKFKYERAYLIDSVYGINTNMILFLETYTKAEIEARFNTMMQEDEEKVIQTALKWNTYKYLTIDPVLPMKKEAAILAKEYDFTTDTDFYNYIVDSLINGQRSQVKSLFNMMVQDDQVYFLNDFLNIGNEDQKEVQEICIEELAN